MWKPEPVVSEHVTVGLSLGAGCCRCAYDLTCVRTPLHYAAGIGACSASLHWLGEHCLMSSHLIETVCAALSEKGLDQGVPKQVILGDPLDYPYNR